MFGIGIQNPTTIYSRIATSETDGFKTYKSYSVSVITIAVPASFIVGSVTVPSVNKTLKLFINGINVTSGFDINQRARNVSFTSKISIENFTEPIIFSMEVVNK